MVQPAGAVTPVRGLVARKAGLGVRRHARVLGAHREAWRDGIDLVDGTFGVGTEGVEETMTRRTVVMGIASACSREWHRAGLAAAGVPATQAEKAAAQRLRDGAAPVLQGQQ
ncbi:hypothetical protein [Streptomyces sp. NPDC003374]